MSNLDSLLERNQVFAAQQSAAGTLMPSLPQALPNVKAIIIGCADMRVDPVHVLGIKPGEAMVMRNIGVESRQGYWNSWGYSDGSLRLQEKLLEEEGNFTSSYF